MRSITAASILLVLGWTGIASAEQLTIASYGGSYQDNQRKVFFKPFSDETGIKIVEDTWNGEFAKVRSQVEAGAVVWDLVQVEGNAGIAGCEEGLFEKLNLDGLVDAGSLVPGSLTNCGLATSISGTVLAYDPSRLSGAPQSWADFWNVDKFPGKRGLADSAQGVVEFALMADGVPPAQVYQVLREPGGVDRAFKKLSEIKPHVVFWTTGAEQVQRLAAGDVVMTTAWNGRVIVAARENNRDFRIAWNAGQLHGMEPWVILKGSPNKEAARRFLAFYAKPEPEAEFTKITHYPGPNTKLLELLDEEAKANLPTSPNNAPHAVPIDYKFYTEFGEQLDERYTAWMASK